MVAVAIGVIIGSVVGGAVAGTAAAGTAWAIAGALAKAITTTVVSGVVRNALGMGRPRQRAVTSAAGAGARTVNIRQPVAPWQMIYGEVRVGGTITYAHVTSDRRTMHLVITVAGHVCDHLGDVWFGDALLHSDATGNATVAPFAGVARVRRSIGNEAGQPFGELVAAGGQWQQDWLQASRSKLHVAIDVSPEAYPAGVPVVTVLARGRRVFDPRDGVTRWTNNAALCTADYLATPDTRGGMGFALADLDTAALIAAANICDERVPIAQPASQIASVDPAADTLTVMAGMRMPHIREGVRLTTTGTLPGGLLAGTTYHVFRGGNGTLRLAASAANALAGVAVDITSAGTGVHSLVPHDEPRYTVDGVWTVDAAPASVLGLLIAAMAGRAVHGAGRWHVYAGAYDVPSLVLTEDDLIGPVTVHSLSTRRELSNAVKGLCIDPNSHWQPVSFPPVRSMALATNDGETIWREIDLSAFVARPTAAQRLARIELLSSREALTVEIVCRLRGWRAQCGRTVMLTLARYGWAAKPFEVVGSRLTVDTGEGGLAVALTLRETAPAVFDWSTSEEQASRLAADTGLPSPGDVGPPTGLSIAERLVETRSGRGVAVSVDVAWGASSYLYGPLYQLDHRAVGAPAWTSEPVTRALGITIDDVPVGSREFRVRALGTGGSTSTWVGATRAIAGLGVPPLAPVIRGLQAIGGLAILSVDPHPGLDVRRGGRLLVRHTQELVSPTWTGAFSIGEHDGYPGDATVLLLPLKAGSYMVRARNAADVLGTVASVSTKQASVLAFGAPTTLQEDTTFPGTHSDTAAAGGVLSLTAPGGNVSPSGTYTFSAGFDFGSVVGRRLTGELIGFADDLALMFDSRTGLVDSWGSWDGDDPGDVVDAWLELRETDDAPGGSPIWSAWRRLDASEVRARGVQLRLQLRSRSATHQCRITRLRVHAAGI